MYNAIESEFLLSTRLQDLERDLATLGRAGRGRTRRPRRSAVQRIQRRAAILLTALRSARRPTAVPPRRLA